MPSNFNKTLLALTLFSAAAGSQLAHADGTGFMLGGGGSYAQIDGGIDIDEIEDITDIDFDDSSFSYNLNAGWRFNKWLSVDAGYWDLGSFKTEVEGLDRKQTFDSSAFTVGGMVSVPLWIMDFYARAGAAMWEADGRYIDEDGTDPYYGLGAAFNIGGSLDLYLEWVRFEEADLDLDTFGLGARWTF
ncbi:MAG: outer membrane beta-barrel protein [Halioglobus sp.]